MNVIIILAVVALVGWAGLALALRALSKRSRSGLNPDTLQRHVTDAGLDQVVHEIQTILSYDLDPRTAKRNARMSLVAFLEAHGVPMDFGIEPKTGGHRS
jgi:hypothetical protein